MQIQTPKYELEEKPDNISDTEFVKLMKEKWRLKTLVFMFIMGVTIVSIFFNFFSTIDRVIP
mgnify:CR=1 FL=1